MKLYVYDLTDNTVVAIITGDTNELCETVANQEYGINDYGWTYSPAFGATDGLTESSSAREITADGVRYLVERDA